MSHDQSPLSQLAAQRNFALMRLRGAKTVSNIFLGDIPYVTFNKPTVRAEVLAKQLRGVLAELEEELDYMWQRERAKLLKSEPKR